MGLWDLFGSTPETTTSPYAPVEAPVDSEPVGETMGPVTQEEPGPFARAMASVTSMLPASVQGAIGAVTGAVGDVASVAKGAWDFNTANAAEMSKDPAVQEAILEETKDIPNQDIIYEQLAHNLAYGAYDIAQLRAWGYGPPEIVIPWDEKTGMFAVAVQPAKGMLPEEKAKIEAMHGMPLKPVIAFRGSTDAVDWADDLAPESVGAYRFAFHKSTIAAKMNQYAKGGVAPDTTGHSLGGTLAQLAATCGPCGRVVTFQSPGIPPEMIGQIPDGVEATHHRAAEDFVAWSGGEHMEGEEFIYDRVGNTFGASHANMLLGGLNELRGGDANIEGIYDNSVYTQRDLEMEGHSQLDPAKVAEYQQNCVEGTSGDLTWVSRGAMDWNMNGENDWYEEMYKEGREDLAEFVRSTAGAGLEIVDNMVTGVDQAADAQLAGDGGMIGNALAGLWQYGRENIYGGDVSGGLGGLGTIVTGGVSESGTSGTDRQLYVDTWNAIEPMIGIVPNTQLFAEVDAAGFSDPALAANMREQIQMATAEAYGPPDGAAWGPPAGGDDFSMYSA